MLDHDHREVSPIRRITDRIRQEANMDSSHINEHLDMTNKDIQEDIIDIDESTRNFNKLSFVFLLRLSNPMASGCFWRNMRDQTNGLRIWCLINASLGDT